MNVTVKVLDSNDNDPLFDRQNYDVSIVENCPRNSVILKVRAVDSDMGANGQVVYGLTAQTQALYGHLFGIVNTTGEIFVKGDIDRETLETYQLIVTAEDLGHDSHPVDVTVTVTADDVNDNRPEITINTLAAVGSNLASVPENADPGTFVAHVKVIDPDHGRNGSVNCSLSDPTLASLFHLLRRPLSEQSETEYQILTSVRLDREVVPRYNLSILCSDGGSPPETAHEYILVSVLDDNDNSPVFTKRSYSTTMSENNEVGLAILGVEATDADSGDNGAIRYSIRDGQVFTNAAALFSVDQRGLIIAKQALDREFNDNYSFQVRVDRRTNQI